MDFGDPWEGAQKPQEMVTLEALEVEWLRCFGWDTAVHGWPSRCQVLGIPIGQF